MNYKKKINMAKTSSSEYKKKYVNSQNSQIYEAHKLLMNYFSGKENLENTS